MNTPLSLVIEETKLALTTAFNQILDDSKLPAYLYEGIILDLLSEVRNRKNLELVSEIKSMQKSEADTQEGKNETAQD